MGALVGLAGRTYATALAFLNQPQPLWNSPPAATDAHYLADALIEFDVVDPQYGDWPEPAASIDL